jgi:hypothetical protein
VAVVQQGNAEPSKWTKVNLPTALFKGSLPNMEPDQLKYLEVYCRKL